MQQLKALWEQYCVTHHGFNLSVLPEEIKKQGIRITYQPQSVIVSRGTFPEYIYFIESGTALGTRHYDDGNPCSQRLAYFLQIPLLPSKYFPCKTSGITRILVTFDPFL